MKAFSYINLVAGLALAGLGAMNWFSWKPQAEWLMDNGSSIAWIQAHDFAFLVGSTCLFGGGLFLILSFIPAIKTKTGIAWGGVILNAFAVLAGCATATHMFS